MEEINGGNMCPTYLYRWTLLRAFGWRVYLHHFVGDDWSRDIHDHPKRFYSIGLRGAYWEEYAGSCGEIRGRTWVAPWFRSFPATHRHRLSLLTPESDCWTLVIVGRPEREWGFWHDGTWIHWRRYVGSTEAESRKAC
jgi:hypothetical protein